MVHIAQQLCTKPQIMHLVSELLDTDELSIINQILPYVLPSMILSKNYDVIQKIDSMMRLLAVFLSCSWTNLSSPSKLHLLVDM